MPLASFAAMDSCYRSSRSYMRGGMSRDRRADRSQMWRPLNSTASTTTLAPARASITAVRCSTALCSQRAACDSTEGLVCGCVKA
jgi:hypothetical protein